MQNDLKQIQKITGQKKKSPAISRALADYLRMRDRRAFLEKALAAQTDYALTNEQLEALDVYETHSSAATPILPPPKNVVGGKLKVE